MVTIARCVLVQQSVWCPSIAQEEVQNLKLLAWPTQLKAEENGKQYRYHTHENGRDKELLRNHLMVLREDVFRNP